MTVDLMYQYSSHNASRTRRRKRTQTTTHIYSITSLVVFFLFLSSNHVLSFQTLRQPSLRPLPSKSISNQYSDSTSNVNSNVRQRNYNSVRYSTKNHSTSSSSSSSSSTMFARANQFGTSVIGLLLATVALYFLGSESGDLDPATSAKNVIDSALPQTATDVVAVAVAEGIGGVIGVGSTSIVAYALRSTPYFEATKTATSSLLVEAVAGADFFLTRAAAVPLLVTAGLDPVLASLFSVFIASVPYEVVKDQARRQQRRRTENELLAELLQEEREMRKGGSFLTFARANSSSSLKTARVADLSTLKPAVPDVKLDIPELVTDVIKWLEYDVLKSSYSGEFALTGLPMSGSMESALFGFLAALSSQLYLDALYLNTNLGPLEKTLESRKRSGVELVSIYATTCLSTAALFSVYEGAKEPVRLNILRLLSGGIEGCVGSTDFDACILTYEFDNPIIDDAASLQAEIRALIVAFVSLVAELQSEIIRMIDEMFFRM